MCAGTRSIPVAVAACTARNLARSQNLFEETFLRLCVDRLRAASASAVWLCDRGFHRVGWLKLMVEMRQHFVVRLKCDVTVRLPGGACSRVEPWRRASGATSASSSCAKTGR